MKNKTAFDNLQNDYAAARPSYPIELIRKLKTMTPDILNYSILDVGCGTGIFTRQLADMFTKAVVCGCDINADMVAKAAKNTTISFKQSDAETLPYEADEFGMITVAQAIQWFDRPAFYGQVKRVLNKNGLLVIIENNRTWQNSAFLNDYEALLEKYSPDYSRHYRDHDYIAELKNFGFIDEQLFKQGRQRKMSCEAFVQMAKSSTKMQTALGNDSSAVMNQLEILLKQYGDEHGDIKLDYETKMIVALNP